MDAKPRKATLRIVGLGDYDPRVNGRVWRTRGSISRGRSTRRRSTTATSTSRRLVQPGANCVGVMLGNSFWHNPNPPAGRYNKDGPQREADEPLLLCAEIALEQADGTLRRIGTDATWRTAAGPIVFSHIFAGEDFDARRQQPRMGPPRIRRPGLAAGPRRAGPGGESRASDAGRRSRPTSDSRRRPSRSRRRASFSTASRRIARPSCGSSWRAASRATGLVPLRRAQERPGPAVRRLRRRLRSGDRRPAARPPVDLLLPGHAVRRSLRRGPGRPRQSAGPAGDPIAWSWCTCARRLPEVGTLRVLQRSVQPHAPADRLGDPVEHEPRADRLSAPREARLAGMLPTCWRRAFQYRYDCRDWFAKILRDIRDAQEPSGRVLTVAPSYPAGRFPGAFNWTVEWGAAAVLLPWHHYQWYGDPQILRDNFDMMRRFTDYVQTRGEGRARARRPGRLVRLRPRPAARTVAVHADAAFGHGHLGALRADGLSRGGGARPAGGSREVPRAARADRGRFPAALPRSGHRQAQAPGQPAMRQRHGACAPRSCRRPTARRWSRRSSPTWRSAAGSRRPATWATSTSSARWPRPAARTCCTASTPATGSAATAAS